MINDKHGFYSDKGDYFLTKCPECHRENWAMVVASGQCGWCGWIHPHSKTAKSNESKENNEKT